MNVDASERPFVAIATDGLWDVTDSLFVATAMANSIKDFRKERLPEYAQMSSVSILLAHEQVFMSHTGMSRRAVRSHDGCCGGKTGL